MASERLRMLQRRFSVFTRSTLNDPQTLRRAGLLAPLLFGLLSVLLGVDENWDLHNYHLYNPFALLYGKLAIDLAPAGIQSYFNPLIDLPYYLMTRTLPGPLIGFVMGAFHGLNFLLLVLIARHALPNLPAEDRIRVPLLLGLAGVLTAHFLSEVGNTMGDNLTSLLELGALAIVLAQWDALARLSRPALALAAIAGFLAGAGMGLKLTNGPYAAALCLVLLTLPVDWSRRLLVAFVTGIGVLIGVAATGFWYLKMWQVFGNPLFPMFGNLFPNSLVVSMSVNDPNWLPRHFGEYLAWPFILTFDSQRIGQLRLRQIIWAVTYGTMLAAFAAAMWRRFAGRPQIGALDPRARAVVLYVAIGFVLWMIIFSIGRYIVAIELLTPLVIFILFGRLFPYERARRWSAITLVVCTAVVISGGIRTWGHQPWATPPYRAELPLLTDESHTTVLTVDGETALAWLATQFSPRVAFVGLGGWPVTEAYVQRARDIVSGRGGPAYVMFEGRSEQALENIALWNSILDRLRLSSSAGGCDFIRSTIRRFKVTVGIEEAATGDRVCRLVPLPSQIAAMDARERALKERAAAYLGLFGYAMKPDTCTSYSSWIGTKPIRYGWCEIVSTR